ncbi:hypothetical protein HJFPF1_08216 [Paramyrothecium foliicola]|nr:hypothetical protein HJFPF1_08216 [Paramyrothecium foliicola]
MRLEALLFAELVLAQLDPLEGYIVLGHGAENQEIYGIQPQEYQAAFSRPEASSSIYELEIAGHKWDLGIAVASNISINHDRNHEGQVTQMSSLTLEPSDGRPLHNESICTKIHPNLKDDASSFIRERGSGQCGSLSRECQDALRLSNCRNTFVPDVCEEYLSVGASSTSLLTSGLKGTGDFWTYASEPRGKGSEDAWDDFVALSEMVYAVVIASTRPTDASNFRQPEAELNCMVSDDENEDGNGESGGTLLAADATRTALFALAIVSMVLAYC